MDYLLLMWYVIASETYLQGVESVKTIVRKHFEDKHLWAAFYILKEFAPDVNVPRKLDYESSSYSFIRYARAYIPGTNPIQKPDVLDKAYKEASALAKKYLSLPAISLSITFDRPMSAHSLSIKKPFEDDAESKVLVFEVPPADEGRTGTRRVRLRFQKSKRLWIEAHAPEELNAALTEKGFVGEFENSLKDIRITMEVPSMDSLEGIYLMIETLNMFIIQKS